MGERAKQVAAARQATTTQHSAHSHQAARLSISPLAPPGLRVSGSHGLLAWLAWSNSCFIVILMLSHAHAHTPCLPLKHSHINIHINIYPPLILETIFLCIRYAQEHVAGPDKLKASGGRSEWSLRCGCSKLRCSKPRCARCRTASFSG